VLLAAILAAIPAQHRILTSCAPGLLVEETGRPTTAEGPARKILHVTCSFDLGGTQTQIRNLCERTTDAWFVHDTVEIFPSRTTSTGAST